MDLRNVFLTSAALAGPSLPVFPVERCKGTKGLKTSGERRRRKNDAKDCFVSAFFKTGIAAKALGPTFA